MKIFEWMQNKLHGSNIGKKKPSSISVTHYMLHEPCKQELSDWPPQALFAIGTFGNNNNNLKEDSGNNNRRSNSTTTAEDSSSFQDFTQVFYLEEVVNNLQNEAEHEENQTNNDIINERLNSSEHSRLELEVKEQNGSFSDGSNIINTLGNFYPRNNLVYNRGRDRCLDSSKSGVSKKSLSFLLKKMFVCSSGFPATPLLKDPHPLSTESRMEKILRAILHKKIYPQGSCSTTFIKKYLENNPMHQTQEDDEEEEEEEEEEELDAVVGKGIKWVNTDSEYIVLEI